MSKTYRNLKGVEKLYRNLPIRRLLKEFQKAIDILIDANTTPSPRLRHKANASKSNICMEFDGKRIKAERETYSPTILLDNGIELIAQTMGYTKDQLKINYSELIPYNNGYTLRVEGMLYFSNNNQAIDGRIIGVLKNDKELYSVEMLIGKVIPFSSLKDIIKEINYQKELHLEECRLLLTE
jgi:hypothetical protein